MFILFRVHYWVSPFTSLPAFSLVAADQLALALSGLDFGADARSTASVEDLSGLVEDELHLLRVQLIARAVVCVGGSVG